MMASFFFKNWYTAQKILTRMVLNSIIGRPKKDNVRDPTLVRLTELLFKRDRTISNYTTYPRKNADFFLQLMNYYVISTIDSNSCLQVAF